MVLGKKHGTSYLPYTNKPNNRTYYKHKEDYHENKVLLSMIQMKSPTFFIISKIISHW